MKVAEKVLPDLKAEKFAVIAITIRLVLAQRASLFLA
jgi:hypothetical protein